MTSAGTLFALLLAGGAAGPQPEAQPGTGPRIVLDGRFDDWPAPDAQVCADADYVYLRLNLPEPATLQAAPVTYELLLELDGRVIDVNGAVEGKAPQERGWDMAIEFSPPASEETKNKRPNGVQAFALDAQGRRMPISAAAIDLAFAPTFAAARFEVRLSRHLEGVKGVVADALNSGIVIWRMVTLDEAGHVQSQTPRVTGELPKRIVHRTLADVQLPAPAAGAVRVVSWNVLKATPMNDPEKFARVLTVLAPDVVLVQEWENTTPAQLEEWFNRNVPGDRPWHALISDGWGVGVVSRLALERLGPAHIDRPAEAAPDRNCPDQAVRLAGAIVTTASGPVAVASVHLKCCGSKDSKEDLARMAEAKAINAALGAAVKDKALAVRIIAGDFNLVGSEPPLTIMRAGPDADGSELSVAPATVLGDETFITWTDSTTPFTPGRLDYLLYSDATADVVRAFVVDTGRMSEGALKRAGLKAEDSRASDHMPLVVDLTVKR